MVGVKTRMDGYKQSERGTAGLFHMLPARQNSSRRGIQLGNAVSTQIMVTKIGLSSELGSRGTVQADLTGS
jgi:hypothetical protein